ncbi:MAG: hypothetical protein P4L65_02880 [Legionella sp.]|nr:hypothetical protein [Legionella sp.]
MTTINELIQKLAPFSAHKSVKKAITALNALAIAVKDTEIENSALQLIELLADKNPSLSEIAFNGVMTLARLKHRSPSSMSNAVGAADIPTNQEAVVRVKSLLIGGLIDFSKAPSVLSRMEQFYTKNNPSRSSFFGFSVTERATPSVSASSPPLSPSL